MPPLVGNLFALPHPLPELETVQPLAQSESVLIERIVSVGHTTPPGDWYDAERDEWVALLQGAATVAYDDGGAVSLGPGDWLLIPAGRRHRVDATTAEPPCVWLAVHGRLRIAEGPELRP